MILDLEEYRTRSRLVGFVVNALRTKLQSCSHGLVHLDGQWITVSKYRDMGLGEAGFVEDAVRYLYLFDCLSSRNTRPPPATDGPHTPFM
jgi:hypothetical protein